MNGHGTLDSVLPYLRALAGYFEDQDITEIMVNPGPRVFVERGGRIEAVSGGTLTDEQVAVAAKMIANKCGTTISTKKPIAEAWLDGATRMRIAAVLAPISIGGPSLTIRKFPRTFSMQELVDNGTISTLAEDALLKTIDDGGSILISGGTGSGKTVLLGALVGLMPSTDRLIVVEDTAEIHVTHANALRLTTRHDQIDGIWESVSMADLIRAALRHRPDRIIVGEIRGGEAWDLLMALNSGHQGSVATIHANSAAHALSKFAFSAMMANYGMPESSLKQSICDVLQLVVHMGRVGRARRVLQVLPMSRGSGVGASALRLQV